MRSRNLRPNSGAASPRQQDAHRGASRPPTSARTKSEARKGTVFSEERSEIASRTSVFQSGTLRADDKEKREGVNYSVDSEGGNSAAKRGSSGGHYFGSLSSRSTLEFAQTPMRFANGTPSTADPHRSHAKDLLAARQATSAMEKIQAACQDLVLASDNAVFGIEMDQKEAERERGNAKKAMVTTLILGGGNNETGVPAGDEEEDLTPPMSSEHTPKSALFSNDHVDQNKARKDGGGSDGEKFKKEMAAGRTSPYSGPSTTSQRRISTSAAETLASVLSNLCMAVENVEGAVLKCSDGSATRTSRENTFLLSAGSLSNSNNSKKGKNGRGNEEGTDLETLGASEMTSDDLPQPKTSASEEISDFTGPPQGKTPTPTTITLQEWSAKVFLMLRNLIELTRVEDVPIFVTTAPLPTPSSQAAGASASALPTSGASPGGFSNNSLSSMAITNQQWNNATGRVKLASRQVTPPPCASIPQVTHVPMLVPIDSNSSESSKKRTNRDKTNYGNEKKPAGFGSSATADDSRFAQDNSLFFPLHKGQRMISRNVKVGEEFVPNAWVTETFRGIRALANTAIMAVQQLTYDHATLLRERELERDYFGRMYCNHVNQNNQGVGGVVGVGVGNNAFSSKIVVTDGYGGKTTVEKSEKVATRFGKGTQQSSTLGSTNQDRMGNSGIKFQLKKSTTTSTAPAAPLPPLPPHLKNTVPFCFGGAIIDQESDIKTKVMATSIQQNTNNQNSRQQLPPSSLQPSPSPSSVFFADNPDDSFLWCISLAPTRKMRASLLGPEYDATRLMFKSLVRAVVSRSLSGRIICENEDGTAFMVNFKSAWEALTFDACLHRFMMYLPWPRACLELSYAKEELNPTTPPLSVDAHIPSSGGLSEKTRDVSSRKAGDGKMKNGNQKTNEGMNGDDDNYDWVDDAAKKIDLLEVAMMNKSSDRGSTPLSRASSSKSLLADTQKHNAAGSSSGNLLVLAAQVPDTFVGTATHQRFTHAEVKEIRRLRAKVAATESLFAGQVEVLNGQAEARAMELREREIERNRRIALEAEKANTNMMQTPNGGGGPEKSSTSSTIDPDVEDFKVTAEGGMKSISEMEVKGEQFREKEKEEKEEVALCYIPKPPPPPPLTAVLSNSNNIAAGSNTYNSVNLTSSSSASVASAHAYTRFARRGPVARSSIHCQKGSDPKFCAISTMQLVAAALNNLSDGFATLFGPNLLAKKTSAMALEALRCRTYESSVENLVLREAQLKQTLWGGQRQQKDERTLEFDAVPLMAIDDLKTGGLTRLGCAVWHSLRHRRRYPDTRDYYPIVAADRWWWCTNAVPSLGSVIKGSLTAAQRSVGTQASGGSAEEEEAQQACLLHRPPLQAHHQHSGSQRSNQQNSDQKEVDNSQQTRASGAGEPLSIPAKAKNEKKSVSGRNVSTALSEKTGATRHQGTDENKMGLTPTPPGNSRISSGAGLTTVSLPLENTGRKRRHRTATGTPIVTRAPNNNDNNTTTSSTPPQKATPFRIHPEGPQTTTTMRITEAANAALAEITQNLAAAQEQKKAASLLAAAADAAKRPSFASPSRAFKAHSVTTIGSTTNAAKSETTTVETAASGNESPAKRESKALNSEGTQGADGISHEKSEISSGGRNGESRGRGRKGRKSTIFGLRATSPDSLFAPCSTPFPTTAEVGCQTRCGADDIAPILQFIFDERERNRRRTEHKSKVEFGDDQREQTSITEMKRKDALDSENARAFALVTCSAPTSYNYQGFAAQALRCATLLREWIAGRGRVSERDIVDFVDGLLTNSSDRGINPTFFKKTLEVSNVITLYESGQSNEKENGAHATAARAVRNSYNSVAKDAWRQEDYSEAATLMRLSPTPSIGLKHPSVFDEDSGPELPAAEANTNTNTVMPFFHRGPYQSPIAAMFIQSSSSSMPIPPFSSPAGSHTASLPMHVPRVHPAFIPSAHGMERGEEEAAVTLEKDWQKVARHYKHLMAVLSGGGRGGGHLYGAEANEEGTRAGEDREESFANSEGKLFVDDGLLAASALAAISHMVAELKRAQEIHCYEHLIAIHELQTELFNVSVAALRGPNAVFIRNKISRGGISAASFTSTVASGTSVSAAPISAVLASAMATVDGAAANSPKDGRSVARSVHVPAWYSSMLTNKKVDGKAYELV